MVVIGKIDYSMYFLVLFIIGIVPLISVAYKFFNRKEISFIDIYIIGCSIYYLLIPYYANYLTNLAKLDFDDCKLSLTLVVVYLYLLLIVNRFVGNNSKFCMTRVIQKLDRKIIVPYKVVYICLFVSFLLLYKITNYSALDSENPEANNQLAFGSSLPIGVRAIWLFALQFRPIFFVLTFKLLSYRLTRRKRFIVYFTLFISAMSYILGSKTNMTEAFVFVGICYYAVYKYKISKKKMISGIVIVACLFLIVFPLLQGFRMTKQYAVQESRVAFTDVVELYFNMNEREKKN